MTSAISAISHLSSDSMISDKCCDTSVRLPHTVPNQGLLLSPTCVLRPLCTWRISVEQNSLTGQLTSFAFIPT